MTHDTLLRGPRSATPALPPARGAEYRIAMICTGNICRSPMAEAVLRSMLDEAGLGARVRVDSGGTARYHVGEPADERARRTLRSAGYNADQHRARHVDRSWFATHDLLIAMDRGHQRELLALAGDSDRDRVVLLMDFATRQLRGDGTVADPYYGGQHDFDAALATVEAGCRGLLDRLRHTVRI